MDLFLELNTRYPTGNIAFLPATQGTAEKKNPMGPKCAVPKNCKTKIKAFETTDRKIVTKKVIHSKSFTYLFLLLRGLLVKDQG